jgi:hypothetical protein
MVIPPMRGSSSESEKENETMRFFCPRIVCGRLRLQYWLFYRTLRWSSAHPFKFRTTDVS